VANASYFSSRAGECVKNRRSNPMRHLIIYTHPLR
jgi:hypothetical protein